MVETIAGEVLLGLYLGVLTGIIPALVAWTLGFTFKYFTGFTVPGLGVVVLAAALAGVSGGLMGLIDPAVANTWVGITALLVVLMMSLWAHGNGDKMGAEFPKRLTLKSLRDRTLEADVIEWVGSFGHVEIRPTGPIGIVEGYPPLPRATADSIKRDSWTFPSELSIGELESKLTERLLSDYDLVTANVAIDERGRASIAAAPAPGGLSRRLDPGNRAVSIDTVLPTGLAVNDIVRIEAPDGPITGTVISAKFERDRNGNSDTDQPLDGSEPTPSTVPTAPGGPGRLTLAVGIREARQLLSMDGINRVFVTARGKRREFELVSVLKQSGNRIQKVTVGDASAATRSTLAELNIREEYGIAVIAIRRATEQVVAPRGEATIESGDDLYVVGPHPAIRKFKEAM